MKFCLAECGHGAEIEDYSLQGTTDAAHVVHYITCCQKVYQLVWRGSHTFRTYLLFNSIHSSFQRYTTIIVKKSI